MCTQKRLHADVLHRETIYTETFAERNSYTRHFLHTNVSTRRSLCTEPFLHNFVLHTKFLHRENPHTKQFLHVTTQLLHTDASTHTETFTQSTIYTKYKDTQKEFLQRDFSVQKKKRKETFPTEQVVHKTVFTRRNLLHTGIFGTKRHLHRFVFTCVKIIVLPQLLKSNRLAKSQRRLPGINKMAFHPTFFFRHAQSPQRGARAPNKLKSRCK